jgi:hypothetical protein
MMAIHKAGRHNAALCIDDDSGPLSRLCSALANGNNSILLDENIGIFLSATRWIDS